MPETRHVHLVPGLRADQVSCPRRPTPRDPWRSRPAAGGVPPLFPFPGVGWPLRWAGTPPDREPAASSFDRTSLSRPSSVRTSDWTLSSRAISCAAWSRWRWMSVAARSFASSAAASDSWRSRSAVRAAAACSWSACSRAAASWSAICCSRSCSSALRCAACCSSSAARAMRLCSTSWRCFSASVRACSMIAADSRRRVRAHLRGLLLGDAQQLLRAVPEAVLHRPRLGVRRLGPQRRAARARWPRRARWPAGACAAPRRARPSAGRARSFGATTNSST